MLQGVSPQLESVLAAGNHASSNLNCQPWRFVVRGNHIEIHIVPEKDQSIYNFGQRYSYFTVGAVIENMVIASSSVGFKAVVELFPSTDLSHVATIELVSEPSIQPDTLAPEILLRITNRKDFLPVKMSDKEKQTILDVSNANDVAKISLTDERKDVRTLAEVASIDDEIIFSNQAAHSFFFEHINWSDKENAARGSGLHLKTLELSPFAIAGYYLCRNWEFMQVLSMMHFEKFFSNLSKATYSTSAAIGGISMASGEPKDFVQAGRTFERLWLTVTKIGLSFQPLNSIPYLQLLAESNDSNVLSLAQSSLIKDSYAKAQKIIGSEGERLVCMFRLGGGAVPSGHTAKSDLSRIVTVV